MTLTSGSFSKYCFLKLLFWLRICHSWVYVSGLDAKSILYKYSLFLLPFPSSSSSFPFVSVSFSFESLEDPVKKAYLILYFSDLLTVPLVIIVQAST